MARSSAEILGPARSEITRGRPRAALKELEQARAELVANADVAGLGQLLEIARGIRTLAPVDTRAREQLLAATEQAIAGLAPGRPLESVAPAPAAAGQGAGAAPSYHVPVTIQRILAPARAEIEKGNFGSALRRLEKARRTLLELSDQNSLGELIELARRLPLLKPGLESKRRNLIDAAQQNVRYLSRRKALKAGESWSDPFSAAKPKTKLPSLPPMTRREKWIAVLVVFVLAGAVTGLALLSRAPQRVAHAIKCPTGDQGSPSWSPDGKEIAFAKNGSCGTQIMAVSLRGRRIRVITDRYGVEPSWSPDGDTILYHSRSGFSIVPAGGGDSVLLRSDDGNMGASWSPDGRRIAFVHGLTANSSLGFHSTMYTMASDGSSLRRRLGHACNPRTPVWSSSGRHLVFACDDGIFDMRSGGGPLEQVVFEDFGDWPVSVAVSPDGRRIAFGWDGVETVSVSNTNDRKAIADVRDEDNALIDVAWSPNGKQIAYSVTGSGADDGLYVVNRGGGARHRLVSF